MRTSNEITLMIGEDEVKFQLTQLPGLKAGRLLVRLGKILGPALTKMAATPGAGGMGEAFAELADFLKPEDFESITLELLAGAQYWEGDELVELGKNDLDQKFRGHVGELFKLIGHSLKVNFGNFFDALAVKGINSKLTPSKT